VLIVIKFLGQKMHMKKVIIGLTLSFLMGSGMAVAADYEKGFQAFQKGVYEVALAEWVPLAEQGDIDSQNTLAAIFKLGLGVKKNPEKAVKWYRLAAEQGDAAGQYGLGTMYAAGEGVPQDYNVALKWFNLAAAQGDKALLAIGVTKELIGQLKAGDLIREVAGVVGGGGGGRPDFAQAGGKGAMAAHNTVLNRPCHANPWLVNDVLRGEYGFGDGVIISDCNDIPALVDFRVAANMTQVL
jgi:hypothetical protein